MIFILGAVAIVAALSAALGVADLLQATRPGATVFQQISARLDVGLSLLVFVCALGLAGIIKRLDDVMIRIRIEADKLKPPSKS